jgi:alkanesulfonate monooxygenase SsuD/methylene tetrahydromethanopterin reductase-like flavin-dependent oxidoreductase (luciferase family)
VEFGLFNSLYVPKDHPEITEASRLRDEIELVKAADRAGFKYTWATEHHFLDEYSHLSANEAFLGYLAAATERIHVGSGIFNITPPVSHPARVAEKVAVLDHLSGGRFEFGVGRGSSTTETKGFGIEDSDVTREMVDETLPQIVRMWKETDYSFQGRFFSMPQRNVLPKPLTDPHPPLWVAAGSPGTFKKAAEMGIGVLCFAQASMDDLGKLIAIYKEEIERCENPVGGFINNNVMVTSQLLCLEDGQRAREAAATMGSGYHQSLLWKYLDTFPRPQWVNDLGGTIPEMDRATIDAVIEAKAMCIGTPEEVAGAVEAVQAIGADQLVFGMLSTSMPIEVAIESVETFGREVLPRFDTDPVHSTTRQRLAQVGL